jgi:hypothetical protein
MACGGDSWGVVVRHTFVEVVQTDNKHARAKSEGCMHLPTMPSSITNADPISQSPPAVVTQPSVRESSRERPVASKSNGGALSRYLSRSQRGSWCAKVCSAVGHSTSPDEDGGKRFEDMQDSFTHSHETRWRVVNTNLAVGVGFRREPLSDGPRVQPEDGVRPNESFRVSEQRVGQDGVLHLRLADGRGWLPSTKPTGEVLCERVKSRRKDMQLPVLLQSPMSDQHSLTKQQHFGSEQEQMTMANKSKTFSWDDVTEEELCGKTNGEEHRTTVVITNIASDCSRDGLLTQLDAAGLAGQYDFVYLPVSLETLATHGYGIVNFVSTSAALTLMQHSPTSVSFSDQRQGLEEHVANFQDSSLMHEGVPDQFKPVLFNNGKRVPFPAPTRPTRMPRELKRAIWRMKNGELAGDCSPSQVSDVLTPKAQLEPCSPCSLRSPHDRRVGRSVANSRRARSRRGRGSLP